MIWRGRADKEEPSGKECSVWVRRGEERRGRGRGGEGIWIDRKYENERKGEQYNCAIH